MEAKKNKYINVRSSPNTSRCSPQYSQGKKVLVITPHKQLISFEKIDVQLLQQHHHTKWIYLFGCHRLELFKLVPKLLWADIAVCWFADWHSFRAILWCKRLGKKSAVIVGGYDIANFPDIPYGIAATRRGALFMVHKILELADVVIANSRFIKEEILANFDISPEKIMVIYHGIDSKYFCPSPAQTKEKLVLTVGSIQKSEVKIKHLDLFVHAAKAFPDCEFWIVGPCKDERVLAELQSASPDNVHFTGPLYDRDLVQAFQRAKVYVQVSKHEGFGMALAEAMACACVPVVTSVTSLPEVVGHCGYLVPEGDLQATVAGIRAALAAPYSAGLAARDRIMSEFNLERREQALSAMVRESCGFRRWNGKT